METHVYLGHINTDSSHFQCWLTFLCFLPELKQMLKRLSKTCEISQLWFICCFLF